ncbi:Transposon Ty3-I Gag-Pol polyprotein,Transposon Ty3-G Gag-Pol polyprotein [Mytilus coruscus]|uniref:Transposon Ty3-I Gag-Pol polyprotein,Transposon Ty3-G Gag-Pol polyprotein n=1 Tax=Mytilus coruscus TaxID=42192 RepID=A0A6J8DAL0_MYTCO|nr:Transposon Ty3-I Gag-Pol polyprotein,Transposon Ty3-G Gag-Pol polyprotein [Mytilus coruscus]
MTSGLPAWVADLLEKGEKLETCLELLRNMQATEREERAAEREREMTKVEMEREVRLKELELREKELTQGVVQPQGKSNLKSKLPKFKEGDDPDVLLRSFEKLSEEDSRDYDKIKTAILSRYELTAEAYREKFRSAGQFSDESFKEFAVRMVGFLRHWIEREAIGTDFDKFVDLVTREQLMVSCSKELKLWIKEQKPKTVDDYISGVTVKLPGVSCNGNKVQVHGLDIVEGEINSDKISVLRDTGCSTVFVHSRFTNPDFLTGQARDICLADGTMKQCQEVCINVSSPYISGDIIALILDTPFADLIVGNYVNTSVPHSMDEVHVTQGEDIFVSDDAVPCHAVETRSQKKKSNIKLEVGQKVLILLPTHTSKLLASWKGPFVVSDKVSPVDYKVKVRGKDKVFHVNMLKLWHERVDDNEDNSVPTDIAACLNIISGLTTDDDTDDSEMSTAVALVLKRKESVDDVKISPELTDEERQQLKELLSEYDAIFSEVPKVTNIIEHRVVTKTDEPIYKRSYPLLYALRDKVKQEINDMLTAGIVEPSNSPYAFPIVLIKKKDNTLRFCVDYRDLNKQTIFDPILMPRMDEVLNKVSRAKYISKIDLTKGYWQVPLDKDSRQKSAFITPFGHYQFTVTPFGMMNSGATFVRMMDKVLAGYEDFADSFIDDIGIFSDTWEYHIEHLRAVFDSLRRARLVAKPSKCSFGYGELEFLGHIAGSGNIKPVQDKVSAIRKFPVPATKKQTDASGKGLGAVLEQEFEDGRRPIMYISKKLSGAECNYAVVEKECFAIVWAAPIEISQEVSFKSVDTWPLSKAHACAEFRVGKNSSWVLELSVQDMDIPRLIITTLR